MLDVPHPTKEMVHDMPPTESDVGSADRPDTDSIVQELMKGQSQNGGKLRLLRGKLG
jgi:hypothetical protein